MSKMDVIWGKARGRADRVVVGVFDMRQMDVPVDLVFVTDHGKHLCHGVAYTFNAAVSADMVCAGREFVYTVIRQNGGRATPEKDVAVHHDVGSAFCGEFSCCQSEHTRAAAETIREKEDVRISSGCGRQRPKVVDTDRDARADGQGYKEDWPANCLAGDFSSLVFHGCMLNTIFLSNPPPTNIRIQSRGREWSAVLECSGFP